MKDKKLLVTGASIAGPTLAYWLNRYGFEVVIAERSTELRLGGQNMMLKGLHRKLPAKWESKNAFVKGIQQNQECAG